MHTLARRQKPGRPRAHFSSALVFQPTGSRYRACVRAKRLFRVSGTRRALYVGRIRTSSCQMRPIEAPASMKAGRAIAVIADWAYTVAKQRRHGIIPRYYSPQVPSTTPRTCHSDGLELGPYQPGRLLGPASVYAGGSMDVLNALGALTV
jgi:hypothetical protein